ncbi:MAG: UDP-glucose 4-epimerase GalE [Henriciella sp.]|nr:UDP-glucose 4-epimerase GalE [Henriciella sp.]
MSKSAKRTVLVTGGAGYVGSHCCKTFSDAGWDVVVFDNLSRGWRDFVKWGRLIEGDLLNPEELDAAIKDVQPDAVAHFAALAYVGESVERPDIYYRNNVVGTLNLLDAMRANGVDKLVFSSTCATYGEPQYLPIDEGHPQAPINPYGRSKWMVEHILKDYAHAFGLQSVALRYFNAAGGDPDGQIGERHEPETHLIPLALRGAGDAEYTLNILGDDYDTRDGTAIRDYIHVLDLADAHLRALQYLNDGGETIQINLGTGTGTSVREIRDSVEAVTGKTVNSQIAPRRPGDPPVLVAEPKLAKEKLGWQAEKSSVESLIRDAWNWHCAELNRR